MYRRFYRQPVWLMKRVALEVDPKPNLRVKCLRILLTVNTRQDFYHGNKMRDLLLDDKRKEAESASDRRNEFKN